ncbi:MAG: YceI family protein [Mucilaginibacter sp.]|nr:YceI family protein [Mucilaginibacter sp.]
MYRFIGFLLVPRRNDITVRFILLMKKIILFILTVLISGSVFAQYKPLDQGSSLNFTIKNFGIEATGKFTGLQGDIAFDSENLATANFDVSIDAGTVNTDNSLRDSHLRGESYFDVKNYPRIHFVSTKVTGGKNGAFVITGKLTIKKQTQVISFPFTETSSDDGLLFKGSFSINRKDYEVGGTSTVSNNLIVSLNILAKKS